MKRRDFLSLTLPATGAIMVAPGMFNKQVFAEINHQFTSGPSLDEYDVVINGAGLSGYFAAMHAAKRGKSVLIVDRRTSPGFEIAAKKRLWMGADGFDSLQPDHLRLFLPEGEKQESKNTSWTGRPSGSDDEVLLFSGSIRKGLLRNLLVNKVHVLLMTDVCGLLTDKRSVQGVLLASKHGLHTVRCRSFVDASDNVLFTRGLVSQSYKIDRAAFVLELSKVKSPAKRTVTVSGDLGLYQNKLSFHRSKLSDQHMFIEFEFPVKSQHTDEIENQARLLAAEIGKKLPSLDSSLTTASIQEYAVETTLTLADETLPKPALNGHYVLGTKRDLTCRKVLDIEKEAASVIDRIRYTKPKANPQVILTVGSEIPVDSVTFAEENEPGLVVPLKRVAFDLDRFVTYKDQCQVLVAGGGTAGAFAGMGAAERGANTLVIDYFNDLGGTKTMGGVMGYYHGVKSNQFFKKQTEDAERLARECNMTNKTGRKIYHLNGVLDFGGRVGSGILCHALVSNQKVQGALICRNGRLQAIKADITIDATGDADVAAFAGAPYTVGNSRTGVTQNYSQWDIRGVAPPDAPNRDYDIIDNTKISELQRGLFISHYEAHFYDFYPMLTVRESRRVHGVYVLDFLDVAEKTHFEDVISLASSDFDPHVVASSEYSKCGFLLPHSNDLVVEIPYRCIVPATLDGLLISGRGFSQTHNALQFTRMSADLLVLGYKTGQIAADCTFKGVKPRDYDVSGLQKEWAQLDYLPKDYTRKSTWRKRDERDEIVRRVDMLAKGHPEYLYECSRLSPEKALPVLSEYFHATENGPGKLLMAKAMAWFGSPAGNDLIEDELNTMFRQEQEEGYPGGYVDDYDFIRGRPKNILEGLFWRINQNIGLLAMSGHPSANATIKHILENTVSGGGIVERTTLYYNGRTDLKFIPFYNRIMGLCFYAERLPDVSFVAGFENLLKDKNIGGFKTEDYTKVRWRLYGGLLEISIASAMARCGGKKGYDLLVEYLDDTHVMFKTFAVRELSDVTGKSFGYAPAKWKSLVTSLSYPRPAKKLVKEVEV